jgi:transposase
MKTNIYRGDYSTEQMTLPLDLGILIEPNDPVVTFSEVVKGMELQKYFVPVKRQGRTGYNPEMLLKVILFAQMENIRSLRGIEKACKTDIRFMWLAHEEKPTHTTIANFINQELKGNIETVFRDINEILVKKAKIDLETSYIDGTKIEANANKYKWVWLKSSLKLREKLYLKITKELKEINESGLVFEGKSFAVRENYSEDDILNVLRWLVKEMKRLEIKRVYGKGQRKTELQRFFDHFEEHQKKIHQYNEDIEICGENRNSYAKTDHDATFMRMKEDYMKNGQLKPGYNLQLAVSSGFITCVGTYQNRDDQGTFSTMTDKLYHHYGMYPKNIVADAGYGSIENYLDCKDKDMRAFVKYGMYAKEKEKKYRTNPYRVENMRQPDGSYVCPQGKSFILTGRKKHTGRNITWYTDQYACENCENCPVKKACTKAKGNREIEVNELGRNLYLEAKTLLDSEEGIEKRIQRSIQVEGAFGVIKQDFGYRRLTRRTVENVNLEFHLIAIGYNLIKYHHLVTSIVSS